LSMARVLMVEAASSIEPDLIAPTGRQETARLRPWLKGGSGSPLGTVIAATLGSQPAMILCLQHGVDPPHGREGPQFSFAMTTE
jgi:hypothetical protein